MPQLRGVIRMDSVPLGQTYFTEEGYLVDRPILTSVGIFEYHEDNGHVRRELRLPEEVFDPESLKSYKSKPIIITHDAGLVTKDNVQENMIGVIMSEGYKSGNDVRAEIVIHDTDQMKRAGLKELSLGYNLDLDETPGVWHGQEYDAIQRNIRVNHLALVKEARAGDQARLNIDSRDNTRKEGKEDMRKKARRTRRFDGVLSPEELAKAIEEYKARREKRGDEGEEEDPTAQNAAPAKNAVPAKKPAPAANKKVAPPASKATAKPGPDLTDADDEGIQDQVQEIKDRNQDADDDMQLLFDIIDTLLADRDFNDANKDADDDPIPDTNEDEDEDPDATEDEDVAQDADDDPDADPDNDMAEDGDDEDCEGENCDEDEDEDPDLVEDEDEEDDVGGLPFPTKKNKDGKGCKMNADSADRLARDRVNIYRMSEKLGMSSLNRMDVKSAKKAVIRKVTPGLRLDGKSNTYISALFDMTVKNVDNKTKKDTRYQMRQMFNQDGASTKKGADSAESHRNAMIRRMNRKKK